MLPLQQRLMLSQHGLGMHHYLQRVYRISTGTCICSQVFLILPGLQLLSSFLRNCCIRTLSTSLMPMLLNETFPCEKCRCKVSQTHKRTMHIGTYCNTPEVGVLQVKKDPVAHRTDIVIEVIYSKGAIFCDFSFTFCSVVELWILF